MKQEERVDTGGKGRKREKESGVATWTYVPILGLRPVLTFSELLRQSKGYATFKTEIPIFEQKFLNL